MAPDGVLSSPSPRSGFVAGEGWSCCAGHGRLPVLPWPAVEARRGAGGGRRLVFVAGASGWFLLLSLFRLVVVMWGAEAGDGAVRAGLVGAVSVGSWVELEVRSLGRTRSSCSDSAAGRRMDHAVVYFRWWLLFSGGEWYGGAVVC